MFRFIQHNTTGVLQTFGRYSKMCKPGLHIYIPFIQEITSVSNRLNQHTFNYRTKTKDNVFTDITIAVQYQILQDDSAKALFALYDSHSQIKAYIENDIRALVSDINLDKLFESQYDICHSVMNNLSIKMKEHGFSIIDTLVVSIDPTKEVKEAMNKINASERLKMAAKNEADAYYIKELRHAEADKERKRLQGEGISEKRKAILNGYKNGIDEMATNFGLCPKDIIDFVMKTQHLDTIEAIGKSNNAKTIFLNHEPNNIRNSIMQAREGKEGKEEM